MDDLGGALDDALRAQFPQAQYGVPAIDPSFQQALTARAAQLYQQTRDAPLAVQQAIKEAQASVTGESDGMWLTHWFGSPGTINGVVPTDSGGPLGEGSQALAAILADAGINSGPQGGTSPAAAPAILPDLGAPAAHASRRELLCPRP
jgi:hypothetical protein